MKTFTARFSGYCGECGEHFESGETVSYDDDGELLAECCMPSDLFDEFGPPVAPRKPKPEPRQPFQGTNLDDMGY